MGRVWEEGSRRIYEYIWLISFTVQQEHNIIRQLHANKKLLKVTLSANHKLQICCSSFYLHFTHTYINIYIYYYSFYSLMNHLLAFIFNLTCSFEIVSSYKYTKVYRSSLFSWTLFHVLQTSNFLDSLKCLVLFCFVLFSVAAFRNQNFHRVGALSQTCKDSSTGKKPVKADLKWVVRSTAKR